MPLGKRERLRVGLREYIGGRENILAREAANALLERHPSYNPLVLHGPTATGKSLLLRGLAHRWKLKNRGCSVILLSGADFARAYAHAVETDALSDFRSKHRQTSHLAIDDFHHLDGKDAAQLELTRTLDALQQRDGLFWAGVGNWRLIGGLTRFGTIFIASRVWQACSAVFQQVRCRSMFIFAEINGF